MSGTQDWRIETDAQDYFGHQQKKLSVADRRPVIRKPSDLVGPGIAATAVRLTDFNDLLATYDGFFSADTDAINGPTNLEAYVGTVTSDSSLGGVQNFTGLTTGNKYQRVFNRNPGDAATIYWGAWELVGSGTGGGGTFTETLPMSIIDAKGDLIVGVADNEAVRQAVGADDTSLVADSDAIGGVKWLAQVIEVVEGTDITVDNTDPQRPVISGVSGNRFVNTDSRTVSSPGDQTITLTYVPKVGSIHVYWNGNSLPWSDWSVVDNIVTVPDPDSMFMAGDLLFVAYVADINAEVVTGSDYDVAVLAEPTLLGYWRLAEESGLVMVDSSGNGRDGVYTSDVILGETPILSNDPDTSAGMHGVAARGVVPYGSWMNVPTFTIESWIEVDNLSSGVLALPNRDTNARSWVQYVDSGGNYRFEKIATGIVPAVATATLDDTSRHYIGTTYDGSFLRQYIDGALVGSPVACTGDPSTLADLAIGATYAGDSTWWDLFYYKGKMSKVAYYSGAQSAAKFADRWDIGIAA